MNLSISVHDEVAVADVIVEIMAVIETLTPLVYVRLRMPMLKIEEDPVDNNSPPFVETLGISIREEVDTKEALS